MGWEERNGRQYLYRKRWQEGRCVSQYVGAGFLAERIEALDEQDAAERDVERKREQDERQAERAIDRQIDDVCNRAFTVARAALLVTGHHTHRGQWRKRRKWQMQP